MLKTITDWCEQQCKNFKNSNASIKTTEDFMKYEHTKFAIIGCILTFVIAVAIHYVWGLAWSLASFAVMSSVIDPAWRHYLNSTKKEEKGNAEVVIEALGSCRATIVSATTIHGNSLNYSHADVAFAKGLLNQLLERTIFAIAKIEKGYDTVEIEKIRKKLGEEISDSDFYKLLLEIETVIAKKVKEIKGEGDD